MPIIPFQRRRKSTDEDRAQLDRAIRKSEEYYISRGYGPGLAEKQAGIDAEMGQAIKKKRGLKNIQLSGVGN